MNEEVKTPYVHSIGRKVMFGFGPMTDQMTHQAFQYLVFTFYFTVVHVNIDIIAGAFILFAIWASISGPLVGPLSDRTKTRVGRRRFWILISIIPLALIMILLFTPPNSTQLLNAVYMIAMIMIFDLIYMTFSQNQLALFPEMFKSVRERSHAALWKDIMTIVGLILGTVMPTFLIKSLVPNSVYSASVVETMYRNTAFILAALVIILGYMFFKFGMKEDSHRITKPKEIPHFWKSLKTTLKNRTFLIIVIANLFNWFVFKLLTTIIPLYAEEVLGLTNTFLLSIMLLVAFLVAAAVFPLMKKLGLKIGMRNAFIVSELIWIVVLIPFWFLDGRPYLAILIMGLNGVGLSGAMYYVDIIIASIIDEDEVKNGSRREGSYYGVNVLINRYSTILVFVAIAIVLSKQGWQNFITNATPLNLAGLDFGLKLLMVVFNIVGIAIVIICLKFFPLHGEKWKKVQEQLTEIRKRKNEDANREIST